VKIGIEKRKEERGISRLKSEKRNCEEEEGI
jgi:hypothetical protein